MESTSSVRTTSPTYFSDKRLVNTLIAGLREPLVLHAVPSPLSSQGDKKERFLKYDETPNQLQLRNAINFKKQITNFV